MTPDKILVTILGVGLIGFIYWFFFGKKENTETSQNGLIEITVDGGYKPSVIKIKKDIKTTFKITRKDQNSCLEELIIPDFKTKVYLPLNKNVEIEINPTKTGEFPFHCGMNMFHGKIVVEK